MESIAAVLEKFNEPLALRSFEVSPLAEGEVLVKIAAAGVCGSDVHMWRGQDPRTPLPIILGHEGVGVVADAGGRKLDILGRPLAAGDRVMWERGVTCGRCYYCAVRKLPNLCPSRRTYGIAFSCAQPPHLRGCYAEYLHVGATSPFIRVDDDIDPRVLVAAACSGATAANSIESARIRPGDSVLVIGPGPLGLFCVAFALKAGAAQVFVAGTARSKPRLALARAFGAAATLCAGETSPEERRQLLLDATGGLGPNAIIDCSGAPAAVTEYLPLIAPGGVYSLPGIAEPREDVPRVKLFEWLARKHAALQGIWVSDTSHLWQAIQLVLSRQFPFERLVTHTFPLADATQALQAAEGREAIKAVLVS